MRQQNLSTVLGQVHRAGQLSRAALTTSTGLNRSTIRTLVAELEQRHLVTEGDAVVTGSPGRPSPVVAARGDGAVVLAADVKVSRIIFAVVGLGGTVHQRVEVPLTDDSRGVAPTVDRLVELIGTALAESPDLHVVGLGVSVAGIGDDDCDPVGVFSRDHRDCSMRSGVSERVPEQIRENLSDTDRINRDNGRNSGYRKRDASRLELWAEPFCSLV